MTLTKTPIPTGLVINSQIPLDNKLYFLNEASLSNLGELDNFAFIYYKGMVAYCAQEDTSYKWKEIQEDEEGLLNNNFIYPDNWIKEGIDYSNKAYNFVLISTASDGSETKITAGTNTTITGNGTTATPYIINSSGGVTVNDATTTIKGILKLANDLGGTADAPTTPTAVHKTGNETIDGIKTFISRVDFQQSGTSSIGLSIATGSSYSQSFTKLLFNKDADGSVSSSDMDNTITGALGNIGIKSSNFGFATLSTENIPLSQTRNFKLPSASGTLALEQNLQKAISEFI